MRFSLFSVGVLLWTPCALATVIDITVGGPNGELVFSPEAISAQVGDQVVYHFNPKNHTVTQSSFANPCGLKAGGVDSGFHPVLANETANAATFTITVNDTNPIWIYCKQGAKTANSHCGKGMVHAINCGADGTANSFTNFKAAALAVGASLNSAAGSSTSLSPSSTSTSSSTQSTGTVHVVVVGGSSLTFSPDHISAQPQDTVVFQFEQKNHTATQSTFAAPCNKLNNLTTGVVGFDSGFMPVSANATTFPTYNYTVQDTKPVWVYCRQAGHCGQGMVFAINSNESSTSNFAAFQAKAKQLNGTSASSSGTSATSSIRPSSSTVTSSGSRIATRVCSNLVVAGAMCLFAMFS